MTTALVTGATGFIGRYLTRDLLEAGWQVRALVRPGRPVPDETRIEVVRGDITVPDSLVGVAEGVDVVFHLAGAGHVAAVSEDAYRRFRAVNVEGVAHLVRACHGAPLRKFVHFSSTAAIGLVRASQIDETTPPRPHTPYQVSKREGERVVLDAWQRDGLPAVIVRPCMVYGRGGFGEFAKMCRWMIKGVFPRVGRGSNLTPLAHVRDVARGARLAAERGRPGEVYLLAGESLPMATMRRIILESAGVSRPYPYLPLWLALLAAGVLEAVSRLTGRTPPVSRRNILSVATGRTFNIDKARSELGFEPQFKLADSAGDVISWLRGEGAL